MIHRCSRCKKDAIHFQAYSGLHLCREHFIQDLERKVKREIRKNRWLRHGDRIGVPLNGGRQTATLLHLLQTITRGRRDIEIISLSSDTGLTAIALGNTLDDDAVSTLTGFVSGDISRILNTGADPSDKIRGISPLATIPTEEVDLYAALLELSGDEDMNDEVGLESDLRSILSKYSRRHPSTLYAVSHIGESIRKSGEKPKE
ncbi:MAG: hypothetical protein Q7J09_04335 [Methanocalculus sp.]|uniref:hypothetical protein n=1 Tax=Methanocalculus sp. TaxID=2004547 RepID=UPI002717481B|nr:hypothetical protein [Methanocalculus sp.]MDO9539216.1 hypothetical protein [Methanocalculus sp.]